MPPAGGRARSAPLCGRRTVLRPFGSCSRFMGRSYANNGANCASITGDALIACTRGSNLALYAIVVGTRSPSRCTSAGALLGCCFDGFGTLDVTRGRGDTTASGAPSLNMVGRRNVCTGISRGCIILPGGTSFSDIGERTTSVGSSGGSTLTAIECGCNSRIMNYISLLGSKTGISLSCFSRGDERGIRDSVVEVGPMCFL